MIFVGNRHAESDMGNVTVDGRVLPLPDLQKWEARHSPTGFEWGYYGSGPAELARAVLIAVFPEDRVVRHPRCFQDFKDAVIARLHGDLWTFDDASVRIWYGEWQADHLRDVREIEETFRWMDEIEAQKGR